MKKIFLLFFISLSGLFFVRCSSVLDNNKQVQITLDANGGHFQSSLTDLTKEISANVNFEIIFDATNIPLWDGYILAGWSLNALANPNDSSWVNDKFDTSKITKVEPFTIYAIWQSSSNYLSSKTWEPGRLYIHYKRYADTIADYNDWNIWIWPYQPWNEEGITFNWTDYDSMGAIASIDIRKEYPGAGRAKDQIAHFYWNSKQQQCSGIGFLVVYKSSITQVGHWKSDGGNTYLKGIGDGGDESKNWDGNWDEYDTIHIFAVENQVPDFIIGSPVSNDYSDPYADIQKNSAVSVNDLNTSFSGNSQVTTDLGIDRKLLSTPLDWGGTGYQIQVSSFADSNGDGFGDIKGITDNLDYLKDLGVNSLWLTPVQSSNNYHGYDTIDFYKIDPKFGTLDDYKELLTKAHEKDFKVFMDLVLNHTADNAEWFKKSCNLVNEETILKYSGETKQINYRNLYNWRTESIKELNNSLDSPHWYPYSNYGYYYYGSFASSMPELNYNYSGTRDLVEDVAKYWLDINRVLVDNNPSNDEELLGVDGFRLDAVKHIYMWDELGYKPAQTYDPVEVLNLHFFDDFVTRIRTNFPETFFVGENFDGSYNVVKPYIKSIDSQFDFGIYYGLMGVFNSGSRSIDSIIEGQGIFKDERNQKEPTIMPGELPDNNNYLYQVNSPFTSNHDVKRAINAANGDANVKTIMKDSAIQRAKLWGSIMLTMPGLVWIYYGDELGLSGNSYKNENAKPGTEWQFQDRWWRQPFKWTKDVGDKRLTVNGVDNPNYSYTTNFYVDKYFVEWEPFNKELDGYYEQKEDANSMFNLYKNLIKLRNGNYDGVSSLSKNMLQYGYLGSSTIFGTPYSIIGTPNSSLLAYTRSFLVDGSWHYYGIYHNLSNTPISGYMRNYSTNGFNWVGQVFSTNGSNSSTLNGYSTYIMEFTYV